MANVLLDHNNDFYKPYSETLYNKDHRSTHKKIRYLKPVSLIFFVDKNKLLVN